MFPTASRRRILALAAVVVVCLLGLAAVLGTADGAGGTEVLLDSGTDGRIAVAETTTVDVVVSDARGGVGGFVAQVELENPDAATITDVTFPGEPGLTDVVYRDGGNRAAFGAVLMDTADTGPVTVATVTVAAKQPGAVDLTLTGVRGNPEPTVADEAGVKYDLTGLSGTSLTVEEGDGPPPTTPVPNDDDDELDLGDWFDTDDDGSTTATTSVPATTAAADDGSTTDSQAATTTAGESEDADDPTTATTTAEPTTDAGVVTAEETTTSGGQPGFGIAVAAVALLGAAALRRRRNG